MGILALKSETDKSLWLPYPLDVIGAQTQGMIGYWLVQELRNAGMRRPTVALVAQTVVDGADPAFAQPTKFIGSVYDRRRARALADRYGWNIAATAPVGGASCRHRSRSPWWRVTRSGRCSNKHGHVVVCGGGGEASRSSRPVRVSCGASTGSSTMTSSLPVSP
ncbi:hypothetical protein NE236_23820 [Actinoallomurus purpureus]|nr:hypothetical protein [Actinoallomurus purpureus]MCO6008011.1 hypothetical protein [Actinoallomurus purpureus]